MCSVIGNLELLYQLSYCIKSLLTTLHLWTFSRPMTNARYQFTIPSTTTTLGGVKCLLDCSETKAVWHGDERQNLLIRHKILKKSSKPHD